MTGSTSFVAVPDPREAQETQGGGLSVTWLNFYQQIADAANGALNAVNNFSVIGGWTFKFPENGTVTLLLGCNFTWNIADLLCITEVGSAVIQLIINGANVGSPILAGTARVDQPITGGHVGNNQDIAVTFSSVTVDCENLTISLRGQRTF